VTVASAGPTPTGKVKFMDGSTAIWMSHFEWRDGNPDQAKTRGGIAYETNAEQVDQYAGFVHASGDDVVDKALNYVFSKDRDFQDFLKTPEAKQVAPTLRVRRGPSKDAKDEAELPTKKLGVGVESTASVPAVKA
jgi:hypothetical protein